MNQPALKPWPADKVTRRSVAELAPYARNARLHSDAQVAQIAASIGEWGWTMPVLLDEAGGIIAGHGRVLAAKKLGIDAVPCMVAKGWSDAQKRAYVIADNKIADNAIWDEELLRIEFEGLEGLNFELGLTGFSADEIGAIRRGLGGGLTDPDEAPEPPAEPVTRPGDVWTLRGHRIVCGDATDKVTAAAALAGAKPHLMVTDPPYGVNYDAEWRVRAGVNMPTAASGKVMNDDRADWRAAWVLFPGDVIYAWHGGLQAGAAQASLEAAGFEVRCQIVWAKQQLVIGRGDYHWQHEPCWYAVRKGKRGHWAGDRKQTSVWAIDKPQKSETGHSTQKPVECMKRPIENNSKPGDAVYEPFSGSGTTIIAGEMTGRRVLAIELSPAYVDVAVVRWQNFTGAAAVHEKTGRTFAEVAAGRAAGGEAIAAE